MISVTITISEEERKATIMVYGHAGQAEQGQDIVCSAASILAYTAAQRVKDIERCGGLESPPNIIMDEGDSLISCVAKDDEAYEEVLSTILVIRTGYTLLAHNYPQYVGLKIAITPKGES